MLDSLIISIDDTHGRENAVLIVGRKRFNESVDIVNAFQGEEALDLYKRLITQKQIEMEG